MTTLATRNISFLVVATSLLQGCYPVALEPGGKAGRIEPVSAPFRLPEPADNLYGLDGLRASCLQTPNTRFSEKTQECFCVYQRGAEPLVFSYANGGSCAPIRFKKQCDGPASDAYLKRWIPGLNKCLEGVAKTHRTSLSVELSENVAGNDALTLARYIDAHLGQTFVKLWSTPEEYFFNSSIQLLVGRAKVGRAFVEHVVSPPPITQQLRYQVTLIEPEVSALVNALGDPDSQVPNLPAPPANISSRWPLSSFAVAVHSRFKEQGLLGIPLKVGGDCRRYCLVEQEIAHDPGLNVDAVRHRVYMAGVPSRDTITIQQRLTGEPLAYLQLNLSGGVSAVLFVSKAVDSRLDGLYGQVEVYDRLWNQIGNERIEILPRTSSKIDRALQAPVASQFSSNGVVLCESMDLDQFDKAGFLNSLRRRAAPVDAATATGSLFGWLPNPGGMVSRFVDPLVELRGDLIPSPDAPTHGLRVASVLLSENRDATLIPISMPNCQRLYPQWAPLVERSGVKVVNFSGTEPIDRRWCETFNHPERFLGNQKPFLWVVAAGNGATSHPTLRCPQNIGPADNLIVVAGQAGSGLWQYSDYGRNYADIAAEVGGAETEDSGTSYSAARVSAVAARLALLFPNLSPKDLRIALLLGTDVPANPLDVRSGGTLNEKVAINIASALSALTSEARTNLGFDVIQSILESFLSHSEAFRRLQIFKEGKIVK